MSTPYEDLTQAQKQQLQALDLMQEQTIAKLVEFIKLANKHQAGWNIISSTLGLLAADEEIPRQNLPPPVSVFADQTRTKTDWTTIANALSVIVATASSGTNLGYWSEVIGPENTL